jgi:hypothetical protein
MVYRLRSYAINASRVGESNTNPTDNLYTGFYTTQPISSNYNSTTANLTNRPNMRSFIKMDKGHLVGANSGCFHTDKTETGSGSVNTEVLGTVIEVLGENESPYIYAKSFTFDGKPEATIPGVHGHEQVKSVRLYYTGLDSAFSTLRQVGDEILITSATDLSNLTFDLTGTPGPMVTMSEANEHGIQLELGKHYFWLSYTLNTGYVGRYINAKLTSGVMRRVYPETNEFFEVELAVVLHEEDLDPPGNKQIVPPLEGSIFYVGVGAGPTGEFSPG